MDSAVMKPKLDGRDRQAHAGKESGDHAMRIGILDGDPLHSMLIAPALTRTDYSYRFLTDRTMFASHFWQNPFNLLVVNWETFDSEALETLRWIRERISADIPVLFLSARTDDKGVSSILDAGADDYLEKPFRIRVFIARINALLHGARPLTSHSGPERFGIYEFDLTTRQVKFGDQRIGLKRKEFELALQFFRRLGEPLSRSHLFETIWKKSEVARSRTLDTHVSMLRARLRLHENGYRLTSVYRTGYRLDRVGGHESTAGSNEQNR
jgi:DNA-binding response OmpR family regulator